MAKPFLACSLPLFHKLTVNFLKICHVFQLKVIKLILIAGQNLDKLQFHSVKPVAK